MNQLEIYKTVLLDGCSIECGPVCICDISKHCPTHTPGLPCFQVTCDNYKIHHSHLYNTVEDALIVFFDLVNQVYQTC